MSEETRHCKKCGKTRPWNMFTMKSLGYTEEKVCDRCIGHRDWKWTKDPGMEVETTKELVPVRYV